MKRGIERESLVSTRMRTKMGKEVILDKDRGYLSLWDRGLKILEILFGSWKLELVCAPLSREELGEIS